VEPTQLPPFQIKLRSTLCFTLSRAICVDFPFWISFLIHLKVGILDVDLCGPSIPHILGLGDKSVFSGSEGYESLAYHALSCDPDEIL
jgi:Mrp family chromosome partitioning ATPase